MRPWLQTQSAEEVNVEGVGMTLREMERKLIESTFARCNGNRERTAQILKIGLRTLSGKLREYGYPPRGGPGSNLEDSHSGTEGSLDLVSLIRGRKRASFLQGLALPAFMEVGLDCSLVLLLKSPDGRTFALSPHSVESGWETTLHLKTECGAARDPDPLPRLCSAHSPEA